MPRYPQLLQSFHTTEIERGLKSLETWRTCRGNPRQVGKSWTLFWKFWNIWNFEEYFTKLWKFIEIIEFFFRDLTILEYQKISDFIFRIWIRYKVRIWKLEKSKAYRNKSNQNCKCSKLSLSKIQKRKFPKEYNEWKIKHD